jgi:predicted DNA-binding protein
MEFFFFGIFAIACIAAWFLLAQLCKAEFLTNIKYIENAIEHEVGNLDNFCFANALIRNEIKKIKQFEGNGIKKERESSFFSLTI